MKLLLTALSIHVALAENTKIFWNAVGASRRAFNCDFSTETFLHISDKDGECERSCVHSPRCTHWMWTSSPGTCHLKTGRLPHCYVSVASGGSCGYLGNRVDEHLKCSGGVELWIAASGAIGAVALIVLIGAIFVAWKTERLCFKTTIVDMPPRVENDYNLQPKVIEAPVYEELAGNLATSVHPAPRPPAFLPPPTFHLV